MAQTIQPTRGHRGTYRSINRVAATAGAGIVLAGLALAATAGVEPQSTVEGRPRQVATIFTEGIDDTTRGYDFSIVPKGEPLATDDLDAPRGRDLSHAPAGIFDEPLPTSVSSFWPDEQYVTPVDGGVVWSTEEEALAAPRILAE